MSASIVIIAAFSIYMLCIFFIAVLAYRRTHSKADYILGGRRLSAPVAALSAGASDMSGWLLLGLPGLAYAAVIEAYWMAGGLLLGTYFNWRYIAIPLRRQTEAYGDALTIPDYLARRFDEPGQTLRITCALFILIFFTFYTAAGLVAAGKLFAATFDLPYTTAVIFGAVIIILYTSIGGFLAVAWTDVVQALVMLAALIVVPMVALSEAISTQPLALEQMIDGLSHPDPSWGWIALLSSVAWGLGYAGQPHILARFMAISSVAAIPKARRIAITWTAIALLAAIVIGQVGAISIDASVLGGDRERIFIVLTEQMLHPIIAGICLAAILSAIMSTADSQLLVASAALTEDLVSRRTALDRQGHSGPRPNPSLTPHRLAVAAIAIVATLIALDPEAMVLDLVAYAWAGFGAGLGPCIVLSLYWPRMSRHGALAGILTGGIVSIVWSQLDGGFFALYELFPAFILSGVAVWAVSRLFPPKTIKNQPG